MSNTIIRRLMILIFLGTLLATISFYYVPGINLNNGIRIPTLPLVALSTLLVSVSVYLLHYLQGSSDESDRRDRIAGLLADRMNIVRQEIESLRVKGTTPISATERQEIIQQAVNALPENIVDAARVSWEQKFSAAAATALHVTEVRRIAETMDRRLLGEVFALGRRANVNLILGIATSLTGLAILAWYVFVSEHNFHDPRQMALEFMTRLSLVVFIEIFAYFFLRLYRTSLLDIKYFQNELTNTEHKMVALEAALGLQDKSLIEKICQILGNTERNFLIKKNETTVSLRTQELDLQNDKSVVESLERLFRRVEARPP